jgi:hypothetical protein
MNVWLELSFLIFPFPFSGTEMGSIKFSSRISRREICSRIPVSWRNFSLLSPSLSLSLSFSFSITFSLYICLSVSLSVSFSFFITFSLYICLSVYLSISLSFVRPCFVLFLVSNFSFKTKVHHFSSSRNSRREGELFLVPENRWREVFGNCFHENFGNWRDMTGKL